MRLTGAGRPGAGLAVAALLLSAAPAFADEGAWASMVGFGPLVVQPPEGQGLQRGHVLLQSLYGFTDRWNYEGTLNIDFGRGEVGLFVGSVSEYVVYRTNHLRWNVGLGTALRVPIWPKVGWELGPLAESALRWTIGWGFGLSLSLQASFLWDLQTGAQRGFFLYPSLAFFAEL